jgi:Sec-independent protein secretion pathway component TatC
VILAIAVLAAAAPGGDPVSMLLIMFPLLILFEASILLARRFGHAADRDLAAAEPAAGESG